MKIMQECMCCKEKLAKHTCKLCGKSVCSYCYNGISQTCRCCTTKK